MPCGMFCAGVCAAVELVVCEVVVVVVCSLVCCVVVVVCSVCACDELDAVSAFELLSAQEQSSIAVQSSSDSSFFLSLIFVTPFFVFRGVYTV